MYKNINTKFLCCLLAFWVLKFVIMNRAIVKTIINKCLGVRTREKLLIVSDDPKLPLANEFYKIARTLGIDVSLVNMPPRHRHGEEPPNVVRAAMREVDAAILITSKSISHTKARKDACQKYGTRIASLPGVTEEILNRSIKIDYNDLRKNVLGLIKQLRHGKIVEVFTVKGTHLTMSIKGRKILPDDGIYTRPGAFGNLPAGEACFAPIEGTTNGQLVIDGSAPIVGRIKKPVIVTVKNGYMENMPFPEIKEIISTLGKYAYNIAELGIGLNPKAKVTGVTLEDEKVRNTAHIAIGNNKSFGGKVSCPCHLDFVFLDPVIYIDGKRLKI